MTGSSPSSSVQLARAPRVAPLGLRDAGWGRLQAKTASLELVVPDEPGWRVEGASGRWFSASHGASGHRLLARSWSARRTVSRKECEAELYVGRPELRQGATGELLEERRASQPAGYDVWVRAWTEGSGLGTALAVGAGPGRCYAVVFLARGGESEVGGALRLAVDGILTRVGLLAIEATRTPREAPQF